MAAKRQIIVWLVSVSILMTTLQGCSEVSNNEPTLSSIASIGAQAFFDPSLSASGLQSCASCHALETGNSAPNSDPVQFGG